MSTYQYIDPHADLDAYEDLGAGNTQLHDLLIDLDILQHDTDIHDNADQSLLDYCDNTDKTNKQHSEGSTDSDTDILNEIRRKRLHTAQQLKHAQQMTVDYVQHITVQQFHTTVIQSSQHDHTVLLLVYTQSDTRDSNSVLLHCLQQFSVQYMSIQCYAMIYDTALANIDAVDCPILLVYKNGIKVKQYNILQFNGIHTDVNCLCYILGCDALIDTDIVDDPRLNHTTRIYKSHSKTHKTNKYIIRSSNNYSSGSSSDGD